GALCNAAAFGDFDGDGDLDLFLANGITSGHDGQPVLQRNELLLGDGEGNFTVSEEFLLDDINNAPAVSRSVAIGDLDGDGNLDLVVGNAGANLLLLGDGAGRFESYPENWPEASDSTYGVALEDVDLDGDLDIVYANTAFNPFAQAILLNQGGAQGGVLGEFEVGGFPMPAEGQSAVRLGLLTCDVDADGDADVLFPIHEFGAGERPDLYLNQGGLQGGEAGTFVRDASFESVPGVYSDLAFGDLDGDSDGDLLFPLSETFEPEANPARTYVLLSEVFQAPNAPLAFRRGDANGDLAHDLSDAVFVLSYLFGGGASPGCLAAADVDDDGEVDISDAVAQLNHFFSGGPPPASPYPGFGDAPGPLVVSCERVRLFD
ncbi:MAG: FG-GAP-like repeat-containing protein, partial [Actinobacteria bacterium]|nr:FG-GAP-like repeat-containing protein [Actinomycetota bacterium]